jgi:N-acylneuraminate cytidylyltransferase
MISWPIETCMQSGVFDTVVVSTDDEEVAAIAREAGAEVPFVRPSSLADDHTPIADVMSHALRELGVGPSETSTACCVYPTAALLTPEILREASALLDRSPLDYVFGAIRCPANTARAFTLSDSGTDLLLPQYQSARTQDLPPMFIDAGQFCLGHASAWLAQRPVLGGASEVLELSPLSGIDIDTPEDWTEAEARAALLPRFARAQ